MEVTGGAMGNVGYEALLHENVMAAKTNIEIIMVVFFN